MTTVCRMSAPGGSVRNDRAFPLFVCSPRATSLYPNDVVVRCEIAHRHHRASTINNSLLFRFYAHARARAPLTNSRIVMIQILFIVRTSNAFLHIVGQLVGYTQSQIYRKTSNVFIVRIYGTGRVHLSNEVIMAT